MPQQETELPAANLFNRKRNPQRDSDWSDLAPLWPIRPGTTYLNHGSFGPPPQPVREARRGFIDALDTQPMDFYLRQFEPRLDHARKILAEFVGTDRDNLVFVENATAGMNVVADSFPLGTGDEILLNNHEYGAIHRIWNRAAERTGSQCVTAIFPDRLESPGQIIDRLLAACSERTRLVVISHITSATALILPVQEVCEAMRERGIAVCIDGPHAPAQIELNIDSLNCDFYTASCHKWLNASLGSGFLYVNPKWHQRLQPQLQSWGRLLPAVPEHWSEEFIWSGTRDPSNYLSIPAAIEFLNSIGLEAFRERTRYLAAYGEAKLCELFGAQTWADRNQGWYGSMCHVRLPEGNHSNLQQELWDQFQIEVPVYPFENVDYLRLSCHLYNSTRQIDYLVESLSKLI